MVKKWKLSKKKKQNQIIADSMRVQMTEKLIDLGKQEAMTGEEKSLNAMWGNVKQFDIYVITGLPERKKKGRKKI